MILSALILATTPQADPAADASACIHAVPPASGTIGTLENRCTDRLVVFMCVTGPPSRERATYFDCAKGQVGSYDVKALGSAPAIFAGARRLHMFACRFPQFLPRDVRYFHGRGLRGTCR
ncbi:MULTISPECIES: hypothetical protein [unclassified Sphingomonas]|uniref:hypothetical protein n=1 Tax=unclassified Sphingomonas TaxID=196159 RepID=UPI0021515B76|nr:MULTISPECIES: hypothetical protein [unclassified Sphingomonas]MCR5871954.1 hypothetical protein [Sphingomonas sp. J344]UUX99767.1 hypothetical protein LRS08_00945 [Sphingomonas sp. J315]